MTQKITVRLYSKPDCRQCVATERRLNEKGIAFEHESLEEPGNLAAAKALGHLSAPVVIAGDEDWSGFRPDLIDALAARLAEGTD